MAGFSAYGGAKNMRGRRQAQSSDPTGATNPFQAKPKGAALAGNKASARVKAKRLAMMKGKAGRNPKLAGRMGFGNAMGFGGGQAPVAAPVAAPATTGPTVPSPTSSAVPSSTAVPPAIPGNQRILGG